MVYLFSSFCINNTYVQYAFTTYKYLPKFTKHYYNIFQELYYTFIKSNIIMIKSEEKLCYLFDIY